MMHRLFCALTVCVLLLSSCAAEPDPSTEPPKPAVRIGIVEGAESAANGSVQEFIFPNGTYRVTGRINMEPAPAGQQYFLWLVGEGQPPLSLGPLRNPAGDVRHEFLVESMPEAGPYDRLIVTLEREDAPAAPGVPHASAMLRAPKTAP